jgi:Transcriptional regulator
MTYLSVFNLANTTLLASPCFLGMVDFKQMELCHLRYFVAVAETLKFTKAAERLRVAQPALSRQVQDLEDEVGVDLLRRSPRGVTSRRKEIFFRRKSASC